MPDSISNRLHDVAAIGVGGCGANIIAQARALNFKTAALLAAEKPSPWTGAANARFYDFSQIEQAARECAAAELCLIFAGLGGNSCQYIPGLCRQIIAHGALCAVLATMPFEFEGCRRRAIAETALGQVKEWASAVFVFPNDLAIPASRKKAPISELMRWAPEKMLALAARLAEKGLDMPDDD